MSIVPFSKRHIKALAKIEKQCFSISWSEKQLEEELLNPYAKFFVYEEDECVGYIGCHIVYGEGYIANVAVRADKRRMGIAEKLISYLKAQARKENAEFLSLEVREFNDPAIKLYEKCGFEKVGKRRNFYTEPVEDAVIMTYKVK